MLRVSGLRLPPDHGEEAPLEAALRRLRADRGQMLRWRIAKKSVDARDKRDVSFVYAVDVALRGDEAAWLKAKRPADTQPVPEEEPLAVPRVSGKTRPVVAGAGPCGLAAALYLARAGLRPLVLERGEPVEARRATAERFFSAGELNPNSNVQFGEGGAGAFSDGKLTTGIGSPLCQTVLRALVRHGAPPEILYLARPHIGTDRLPQVVASVRGEIESLGGSFHFSARLTGLLLEEGRLRGVVCLQGGREQRFRTDILIAAPGHSARDTLEMLQRSGLRMAPKSFSLGLRIEHEQAQIDRAQYGAFAGKGSLPPAEYRLACRTAGGRGAYSFCMCPGGRVVGATSDAGRVCVNGMSPYARDGENANAAILVDVRPEDYFRGNVLDGFGFQARWERLAFARGGGNYRAPAQRVEDFLLGRPSFSFGAVRPSCLPGVTPGDLAEVLPDFAVSGIREAIRLFDRRLKGFAHPDAVLTGVETRSSCPVSVPRGASFEGSIPGVYPAGEGAGHAGGIMSAAVDGIRAAQRAAESLREG